MLFSRTSACRRASLEHTHGRSHRHAHRGRSRSGKRCTGGPASTTIESLHLLRHHPARAGGPSRGSSSTPKHFTRALSLRQPVSPGDLDRPRPTPATTRIHPCRGWTSAGRPLDTLSKLETAWTSLPSNYIIHTRALPSPGETAALPLAHRGSSPTHPAWPARLGLASTSTRCPPKTPPGSSARPEADQALLSEEMTDDDGHLIRRSDDRAGTGR